MKNLTRLTVLGVLAAASASLCFADSISLGSFATGTTASSLGFSSSETAMNFAGYTAFATPPATATTPPLLSGTANSYALSPDGSGVWAPPTGSSTWVGYASTAGPGGTNPPYGYYQFTTGFTAAGGSGYSGSISLLADDTAEILLNGAVIVPFSALGSDVHCSDSAPARPSMSFRSPASPCSPAQTPTCLLSSSSRPEPKRLASIPQASTLPPPLPRELPPSPAA